MTVYLGLAILTAFAAFSLLNKAITRTVLTLPIVFAGFGWLLSDPLHAHVDPLLINAGKSLLGQITLILVL